MNLQFNFVTAPISNESFKNRIFEQLSDHLGKFQKANESATTVETSSRADPIIPPLTPKDTALFPSVAVNTYVGCVSPWIDLCSSDPVVANVSRQILNVEINYASFCGVRSVIIPGPREEYLENNSKALAQYSRAVLEALKVGSGLNFLVHMPMYKETGQLENATKTLSSLAISQAPKTSENTDVLSAWDAWHQIRSVCSYNMRLSVGKLSASSTG